MHPVKLPASYSTSHSLTLALVIVTTHSLSSSTDLAACLSSSFGYFVSYYITFGSISQKCHANNFDSSYRSWFDEYNSNPFAAPQDKNSSSSSTTMYGALWNHNNYIYVYLDRNNQSYSFLLFCFTTASFVFSLYVICHTLCHKCFVQPGCLRPVNGGNSYCYSAIMELVVV